MPTQMSHEDHQIISLAVGRILRMAFGDVPYDAHMYTKCRQIIMERLHPDGEPEPEPGVLIVSRHPAAVDFNG